MVKLVVKNVKTTIIGQFNTDLKINGRYHELLRTELSYMVDSADYSPAFKEKRWDGRISLYNKKSQNFPTGLMNQVLRWLKEQEIEYKIDDQRYKPESNTTYTTRFKEFNRELRFYQEEACARGVKKKRGIFSIATGGGKSLDVSTPILTKRGWSSMGDVVDGDCVFDEHGNWCNVIKAHEICYKRDCYKISFSTGENIIADEFHLWTVYDAANTCKTITTSEIDEIYLNKEYKSQQSPLFIKRMLPLNYANNANKLSEDEINYYKQTSLHNLFIPNTHLTYSISDRCLILNNILKKVETQNQNEIIFLNESLGQKVAELMRGLGFYAETVIIENEKCLVKSNIKHSNIEQIKNCNIIHDDKIYIESITAVESRPVRCLTVDSPSKLYLVGKTLIPTHNTLLSCELIARINVAPFLFIVPSQSLLEQTRAEFIKYLMQDGEPAYIGMIGDGVCDINPNGINVATYQSLLAAHNEKYQEKSTIDPITKRKIAGNQVVNVPERKSLVQLEAEEQEAISDYNQFYKKTHVKYQSELQSVEHIVKETERDKKIKSIERKIEKECKKYREIVVKTKNAVKTRKQTLSNQQKVRELCTNASGFLVDEAHIAAVIIESLGEKMEKAYYRYGLSATAWREDNQEIRITGTMGEKIIEVSASDLIDLGYLVPPKIFMIKNNYTEATTTWSETYNKHIVNCWQRNYRIKQIAEACKEAGYPTIILVEQKEHGYGLESMIKDSIFVPGSAKGDGLEDDPDNAEKSYRRLMLDSVERNEIIMIATQWANVGIDAPRLMVVILAGSNKSASTTYQQIGRILRPVGKDYKESVLNGKPLAIVIDFMEEQKILHKHSVRRKKVYQGERSWSVSVVG
jgi:superfamily II DNA or RNA helicase